VDIWVVAKHIALHNRTVFRKVELLVFSCKLVSHSKFYK
jgi:hypothetical protein